MPPAGFKLTARFALAVGLLAAVALGLAWAGAYRPVIAAGRAPVAGPYRLRAAVAGLKLHVFNTGMNRMSPLLVGARPPWRPAPAFVIEHPRQGLIVFDAGLPAAVARKGAGAYSIPTRWLIESRTLDGRTLDAQMREAGLDPLRVRWVILSHLHEDHTGAVTAFPNATFIVGPGASAEHLAKGFRPKWRSASFAGARALPPFDAAVDLFGDGSLTLAPGGGHSREDLMALLALPEGPALLAGDAVVHRAWLASNDVQRLPSDPARAADVRNQVRALLTERPDLLLFCGHDTPPPPEPRPDLVIHHPAWFDLHAWDALARGLI